MLGIALCAVVLLCFLWPQAMLAPGPVMPAHAAIAGDCFACHTPLRGASATRCIACHLPARIGLFSVKGAPLRGGKAAFHQQLAVPACMACHSDHAGPALAGHRSVRFSHQLLQPAVRGRCASCHIAPADGLHRQIGALACAQCHSVSAWKPARFEHDRLFRLEGAHAAPCATCHADGNFARYSCYGCHEHQPAQVQATHREEGIAGNIDDCARCHRSASGEGGEGGEGGDRRRGGGDDD